MEFSAKAYKKSIITILCVLSLFTAYQVLTRYDINSAYEVGESIDEFNGVHVYYNGGVNHVSARHLTDDGYNLGLKYQCVEFVKRYYYEYYGHKMPDTYGHAKSFYNSSLANAEFNEQRGLIQYKNGSAMMPQAGDIVVYKPTIFNRYGHVSIVAKVNANQVEVIQQNAGPYATSRDVYALTSKNGLYQIENRRVLGWLRFTP